MLSQGYDGGDCCECTCVAPENSWNDDGACSHNAGFACIDPEAPCVDDDDITVDMAENCDVSRRDGAPRLTSRARKQGALVLVFTCTRRAVV